jgi:hypothetical protein
MWRGHEIVAGADGRQPHLPLTRAAPDPYASPVMKTRRARTYAYAYPPTGVGPGVA